MEIQHLLQNSQNKVIGDKYKDEIIFRLIDLICPQLQVGAKRFAIKSGELFYNCIYSLDALKTKMSYRQSKEYLFNYWHDILLYFQNKSLSLEDDEVCKGAMLVAYTYFRLLIILQGYVFSAHTHYVCDSLMERDSAYIGKLYLKFNKAIKIIGEPELRNWLASYMASDQLLSNEIGEWIDASFSKDEVKRKIDRDKLDKYFIAPFRGIGENKTDWIPMLIHDLEWDYSESDWCRIAVLIYNSKYLIPAVRPKSFKTWYESFANIVGCSYNPKREQRKHTPTEQLKKRFSYVVY